MSMDREPSWREDRKAVVSIVDDDNAMRAALTDLLDAAGYRPQAFSSGEDFMASPDALSSDVVITDIQMKEMDGLALMARLREVAPKPLPVIIITARQDESLEASAIAQGCHAFLRKPFEPDALVNHVIAALDGCGA